jgi:hypothetical protein
LDGWLGCQRGQLLFAGRMTTLWPGPLARGRSSIAFAHQGEEGLESCLVGLVRPSISRTGRRLSIDKKDRQRGNDEEDPPMVLELKGPAEEGAVVMGGE